MKNSNTVVALLVGILLVGGLIIWDVRKTKQEEMTKKSENLLFSFKANDIFRIDLLNRTDGKDTKFTLTKTGDDWQMISPLEVSADQVAVKQLVEAVQTLKYVQSISDKKDQWPRYELDPAQIKLLLTDSKGKLYGLSVGTKTQTGYDVYVGIEKTGKVYTTSYSFQQAMNKSIFNLRNKQLTQIDSGQIKGLTYRSPEPFTAKFLMENNQLQLTSPEKLPTSPSDVLAFIDDVNTLTALEIKDKPGAQFDKKFRDSTAKYELAWTLQDNTTRRIEFGVVDGDLWASDNSGETYLKFERERDQKKIRKTLTDFRDKQVVVFSPEEVVSVTVDGKTSSDIKGNTNLLVSDLLDLRAEDFMESAPVGANLAKPDHTVQVVLKSGIPMDLKLWKIGESVYIKIADSKTIYKTNNLILNSLQI